MADIRSNSFRQPSAFEWSDAKAQAAIALASGKTHVEAGKEAGVSDRTIRNWLKDVDFAAEVDRLSLMVDIASRAQRLRIAMRVVREAMTGKKIRTEKDVLEWLKFAQSETDGIKLDLPNTLAAAISQDGASMATGGPGDGTGDPESEAVH